MNIPNIILELRDYGGRRSGIDRRYFSYSDHIPERRSLVDRRTLGNRRSGPERRFIDNQTKNIGNEKRTGEDRRSSWA
jgi:hypothetical protein